jgi:hypothetical protein
MPIRNVAGEHIDAGNSGGLGIPQVEKRGKLPEACKDIDILMPTR